MKRYMAKRGSNEAEPKLFASAPLNVWREVYHGRWASLRLVQKAEFIIEVTLLLALCGSLIYVGLRETVWGTIVVWGAVIAFLAAFSFVLTRFIR